MAKTSLKLPPLPSLKEILRIYDLKALKGLSQNFLLDMNICNKMVKQVGSLENAVVWEVGPGPGGITRAILGRNPAKVGLVEKDRRFLPVLHVLREAYGEDKVDIVHGDVLTTVFKDRISDSVKKPWDEEQDRVKLIGNLPFNISNPLLIRLVKMMSEKSDLFSFGRVPSVLTFQKEVADRIVAEPHSPCRCRLSVISQFYADSKFCFVIPGRVFVPEPDVDVGVVKIIPKVAPIVDKVSFEVAERVLTVAFNSRQKYCQTSLSKLFPPEVRREMTEKLLKISGLPPTTRSYEITNEGYRDVIYAYDELCKEFPGMSSFDHRQPNKFVGMLDG